ncbi:MAG: PEGA domain-containing protein [Myxococcales bacterium]|nr:PEGA domain-containing protein [Myxococcales bacterium]
MAVAGLLVVGLVAAMVVFFIPRNGTLVVTVAGPGNKSVDAVQVFVDGNKRCDTSPCRVTELSTGTHMVKVTAAGYQPTAEQGVKVATGEDAVLNVTLSRASEGTGVKVSADTIGSVKLYVDGKEIGPLPQELRDMTPGEHVIKIAGDRYEAWEKRIAVEEGQVQSIEPKLKVVKGLATIKAGTGAENARVLLVSGNERRPIPKLPIKIDITTDKPWSIVATKAGFEDFRKDISFRMERPKRPSPSTCSRRARRLSPRPRRHRRSDPVGGGTEKPEVGKPLSAEASRPRRGRRHRHPEHQQHPGLERDPRRQADGLDAQGRPQRTGGQPHGGVRPRRARPQVAGGERARGWVGYGGGEISLSEVSGG